MALRVAGGFAAKLVQSAKSSMNDVGWMVGELRKHRKASRELARSVRRSGGDSKKFFGMSLRRHRLLEKDYARALGKVSDRRIAGYLKEMSPKMAVARKDGGMINRRRLEEYGQVQFLRRTRAAAKRRKAASKARRK